MRNPRALVPLMLILALVVMAGNGCRDDITAPTQGFIEVDTGGVDGVSVVVDGISYSGTGAVGPFDAGAHVVEVVREFYEVTPSSVTVEVVAADTVRAEFAMELVAPGNVQVTARDELLGTEIRGGEIFLGGESGPLEPTGVTTPGTLQDVPPGNTRIQVRTPGREDSPPVRVSVIPLETVSAEAELGPLRGVLAEMFTYVTCPNCPPAADELEAVHSDFHGQVHVIEWHSIPALPLGDARWLARQRAYTGGTNIGWPAVIFEGGYLESSEEKFVIGSQESDLAKYRARTENYLSQCGNDCPVAMVLTGTIDGASAEVTVRVKRRAGAVPAGLMLRVVLIENEVIAPGNDPPYNFVPRDLIESPITLPGEGEISEIPLSITIGSGWSVSHLDCIAYVQSDATGEILAVAGLE